MLQRVRLESVGAAPAEHDALRMRVVLIGHIYC